MEFEEELVSGWRQEREDWRRRFDAGAAALAPLFASARRVQCALFLPPSWPSIPVGSWGDFPCYALGRERDAAFAARLGRLVLDADSYLVPGRGMKLCEFVPTVGFRVWGNQGAVDVVICFGCLELLVLESDPSVSRHTIGGQEGPFRVCGDFDPAAEPLAGLAREALPDWESSPLWRGRQ